MREMVLNHASVSDLSAAQSVVLEWLEDVVRGMAELRSNAVVVNVLRTGHPLHDLKCSPDHSLWDMIQSLRERGDRDAYRFIMRLNTKCPLLHEISEDHVDRFKSCEGATLTGNDGDPLVLCAITDWILVGFPSADLWDRDRCSIRFEELHPDEVIVEADEEIDQLTKSDHAQPISERHRETLVEETDPANLWENRGQIFPNLVFGPGVEGNLMEGANNIRTIARKLAILNNAARDWAAQGGAAPDWGTKVTPETAERMNDPAFRNSRAFDSHRGMREVFGWHARFGNGGRIHLRFDARNHEIEIGYIGPHLPR